MNLWKNISLIILGAIFFVAGGILAYQFYYFDLGIVTVTFWRDVIIFAVLAFIGLIALLLGIKNILKRT